MLICRKRVQNGRNITAGIRFYLGSTKRKGLVRFEFFAVTKISSSVLMWRVFSSVLFGSVPCGLYKKETIDSRFEVAFAEKKSTA